MIVSKRISFDAAHYLPNYIGKCANMHGHHWVLEVGVEGDVKSNGMVIDFIELKLFLQAVKEEFDHKLINAVIQNPTCENVVLRVKEKFDRWSWGEDIKLKFIRCWETEDSYALLSY